MKKTISHPTWTALITPFKPDYQIDFKGLETLLRLQEQANNGILVLGSTGEALALENNEKEAIVEFAAALNLKVPLMVGVGGFNLKNTLKWIESCEKFKIDAYLLVTPIYAKPGPEGQYAWFLQLLNKASQPCMLYNIPGRAGCALNLEAAKRLEAHPNFWAIKESSGNLANFHNYVKELPSIAIFSGEDPVMFELAGAGAKGLVSVASNAWPKITHKYVQTLLNQPNKNTLTNWKKASQSLFLTSNPVPIKGLLHKLGIIETPLLRPPLNSLDLKAEYLEEILAQHQLLVEEAQSL